MYKFYSGATARDSALKESHDHDERLYNESDLLSAKNLPYQFEQRHKTR